MVGKTCEYVSSVSVMLAWPKRSLLLGWRTERVIEWFRGGLRDQYQSVEVFRDNVTLGGLPTTSPPLPDLFRQFCASPSHP